MNSTLREFALFPKLPFELRIMIWQYGLQPRIVEIKIRDPQQDSKTGKRITEGQHSNAPIPILLYTCTESRKALKAAGYELAFGTEYQDPQIWFNFSLDVLYVTQDFCAGLSTRHKCFDSSRQFSINGPMRRRAQLVDSDKLRVRRLAVRGSAWDRRSYGTPAHVPGQMIELFGNLTQLLIVDNEISGSRRYSSRTSPHDLLGYIDCDVAAPPTCWGTNLRSTNGGSISEYMRDTLSSGMYFFEDEIKILKQNFQKAWEVRNGKDYWWTIPADIRIIHLVNQAAAHQILNDRKQYWDELATKVWAEMESGPPPQAQQPRIDTDYAEDWFAEDWAAMNDY